LRDLGLRRRVFYSAGQRAGHRQANVGIGMGSPRRTTA
jgi:hypothetical protein